VKAPPPKPLPPPAIVAERDQLISFEPEWQPLLDRLCSIPIWNQLSKRSPVIPRPQLIKQLGTVDEKWSDRDLALQAVLLNSFYLVTLGVRTFTATEENERVHPYLARADRLRAEAAALLEEGEDSEAAEHARAIERAAAFCEREAYDIEAAFDENDTLRVQRHQASPYVRGFCRRLTEAMRFIYGDVLYGTVASIATEAFNQTISKEHVRYWCK
jgi:hypothetical protein